MITKIQGEAPFQVLTNNFSISPSQEGYTLQISADGKNYSNLFSVGPNVTRLVTGVAANSYYRLLGNRSNVSVNWMKTCVTEGSGGGGNAGELEPVNEFPVDAPAGTVVALASGGTVGVYQFDGTDWAPIGGGDMSNYYTKAETDAAITAATQDFVTEDALSGYTSQQDFQDFQDAVEAKEEVVASALTELHDSIVELSGTTGDFATEEYVDAAITSATQDFVTEADITAATSPIQEQVDDIERVTATALTELHDSILELSGATGDFATEEYVDAAITSATQDFVTEDALSGYTSVQDFEDFQDAVEAKEEVVASALTELQESLDVVDRVVSESLVDLEDRKVWSEDVHSMVKLTQAAYDDLVSGGTVDNRTFYIIIG